MASYLTRDFAKLNKLILQALTSYFLILQLFVEGVNVGLPAKLRKVVLSQGLRHGGGRRVIEREVAKLFAHDWSKREAGNLRNCIIRRPLVVCILGYLTFFLSLSRCIILFKFFVCRAIFANFICLVLDFKDLLRHFLQVFFI